MKTTALTMVLSKITLTKIMHTLPYQNQMMMNLTNAKEKRKDNDKQGTAQLVMMRRWMLPCHQSFIRMTLETF
jgi:hypothetical protein